MLLFSRLDFSVIIRFFCVLFIIFKLCGAFFFKSLLLIRCFIRTRKLIRYAFNIFSAVCIRCLLGQDLFIRHIVFVCALFKALGYRIFSVYIGEYLVYGLSIMSFVEFVIVFHDCLLA